MTFYRLDYIEAQNDLHNYIKYGVIFAILLFLLVVFSLYLRHRLETKFRDLSILLLLLLLFMLGVQYTDYTQNQSQYAQSSQMEVFIKAIAKEYGLKQQEVLVNSTQLTDGIIVKLKRHYYTVTLSSDQQSYRLSRTHLLTPETRK